MSTKTTDSTQIQAIEGLMSALRFRRLPSKSETDFYLSQLEAIRERIIKARVAREHRDADEVTR